MIRLLLLLTLLSTTPLWAAHDPVSEGARLFASAGLGGSNSSCADCHANGKGLKETAAYDDGQLREMINFCIRDAMHGRMLPLDDPRLDALRAYLRSLAQR